MRIAKVFFGLLFGVVFLITLVKVLFIMLGIAAVGGAIFLASRAFGYRRYQRMQWEQAYGHYAPQAPFVGQQHSSPFEQPLNPNWQRRQAAPGRRIEVL